MKNLDASCVFFHLNFLNPQVILVQKIYNVHVLFCRFYDVKNEGQFQQPTLELVVLRKANLIF